MEFREILLPDILHPVKISEDGKVIYYNGKLKKAWLYKKNTYRRGMLSIAIDDRRLYVWSKKFTATLG